MPRDVFKLQNVLQHFGPVCYDLTIFETCYVYKTTALLSKFTYLQWVHADI
uniref:Uncharacterized protein n=1 Tax=Anguilla anguilla TaxID=7936 RepID=A0A0E9WPY7_ANGAN